MLTLSITLLVVFCIAASIALLRLIAKYFGAGNPSWKASVLAHIIPGVIHGLGYAVGMPEWTFAIMSIVVGLWVLMKFLDTSIMLAIGIAIVHSILISIVIYVGVTALIFIFGVGALAGALGILTPEELGRLEQAAEPDQEITLEYDDQERAVPEGLQPGIEVIETPSEYKPKKTRPSTPPKRVRHSYQEVPINTASNFVGGWVRIHYKDGRIRKGTLTSIDGPTFNIEQVTSGGSFGYSVTEPEIERLEAWKPIN